MQHRKQKIKYISARPGFWQSLRCSLAKYNSATRSNVKSRDDATAPSKSTSIARMVILAIGFVGCFAALTHHIYVLQVKKHTDYDERASRRVSISTTTNGLRGRIYDLGGELLAGNIITQNIFIEPKRIREDDRGDVADFLAKRLELDSKELQDKFMRVIDAPVTAQIACELSRENADIISCWKLPAVEILPPKDNSACHRLVIYPKSCTEDDLTKTVEQLSPFVGLSVKEIKKQIDKAINMPKEIIVKGNVDFIVGEQLKKDIIAFKSELRKRHHRSVAFPVRIEESSTRCYPRGEMLANLLGFMNTVTHKKARKDVKVGFTGLEMLFDHQLTAQKGQVTYQRDSKGNRLTLEESTVVPAKNGVDVFLTIQAPIQRIAEEELAQVVEKYSPERAYAIMMNPHTGAIMALAQYPTFNPNDRTTFKDSTGIQNHCLTEVYEPGSIMKPIPVSYALDKGIVNLDSQFFCENGRWSYGGKTLRDTHDNKDLSVSDIIAVSSNIGTAKIAIEMGQENLYRALKAFGFGQQTHIGFIPEDKKDIYFRNETAGLLKALERWDYLSITRYPIGQGVSCSPIQLLQAYGAIANNGTMMQPYIIDRIMDGDDVTYSVPRVKGQPLTAAGAQKITQALIEVVNSQHGTGKRAALKDFTVAGKTGTGQIWCGDHYAEKLFTSSFVGFVPAEAPEFVMIVSVKRVSVHGGTACGPVFKNIAQRTLEYLQIEPAEPKAPTATTLNTKK